MDGIDLDRMSTAELRESLAQYRSLYDDAPVMMHSIDREGCTVQVNDHRLQRLGYERHEVIGRHLTDFLTAASQDHAVGVVLPRFFETGRVDSQPYAYVRKNGEVIEVLVSGYGVRGDDGAVSSSIAVVVDITERTKAEQELRRVNTDLEILDRFFFSFHRYDLHRQFRRLLQEDQPGLGTRPITRSIRRRRNQRTLGTNRRSSADHAANTAMRPINQSGSVMLVDMRRLPSPHDTINGRYLAACRT